MENSLPSTQWLTLENCEENYWMLLVNNIISEVKTTALIERSAESKVRIKLVITKIIPPFFRHSKHIIKAENNYESFPSGLAKSHEFLNEYLDKTTWILMGYIDGKNQVPIIIMYIKALSKAVYTAKLKNQEVKQFFPELN